MIARSALLLLLLPSFAISAECDCTSYPFKPNPPCFSKCSEKLSKGNIEAASVKNIDADVKSAIDKLSSHPERASIDFSKINDKFDLEKAAKATQNKLGKP